MTTLVTGASGFLGREIVAALRRRGEDVVALVRPASRIPWDDPAVSVRRLDLRGQAGLEEAVAGVETVVHLAAAMGGSEQEQFATTVQGTERLVEAMGRAEVRHVVLASSIAVYDWTRIPGVLNEDVSLEEHPAQRDPYTLAKLLQERILRRASRQHRWKLSVLRPGWVWGKPDEYPPRIGRRIGQTHVVFGSRSILPLTHVTNCADCFAHTVTSRQAGDDLTVNVLDDYDVTAWHFLTEYLRRAPERSRRVPVPYTVVRAIFGAGHTVAAHWLGPNSLLARYLSVPRFQAGYRPVRYDRSRLHEALGWSSPLSFDDCFVRTYGPVRR